MTDLRTQIELSRLMDDDFGHLGRGDRKYPDLDGVFRRQKLAGQAVCEVLDGVFHILRHIYGGYEIDEVQLRTVRGFGQWQKAHIAKYSRLPHNPHLPDIYCQLGGRIDRLLTHTCSILVAVCDVYELPEKIRIRQEMIAKTELRRQERIEARRRRKETSSAAMSAPPRPAEKRPKVEPRPRCEKCGKRSRAVGKLCAPCAQWQARA